jgi:hypothetical protein
VILITITFLARPAFVRGKGRFEVFEPSMHLAGLIQLGGRIDPVDRPTG